MAGTPEIRRNRMPTEDDLSLLRRVATKDYRAFESLYALYYRRLFGYLFKLMRRAEQIPLLEVIEFDNRMEELVAGARAVVSMGGYNTYCEILSFDKPALIVPRVQPREEQLIRALRASELGLVDMLLPDEAEDPHRMSQALKSLLQRPAPSQSAPEAIRLEGLPHISQIVGGLLDRRQPDFLSVVKG